DVDARRVDAVLDPQGFPRFEAALQLLPQLGLRLDLLHAAADQGQLLIDRFHDWLPCNGAAPCSTSCQLVPKFALPQALAIHLKPPNGLEGMTVVRDEWFATVGRPTQS